MGQPSDAELIDHVLDILPDLEQVQQLLAPDPGLVLLNAIEAPAIPEPAIFEPPFPAPAVIEPPELGPVLPSPPKKPGSNIFGREQTTAFLGEAAQSALTAIQRDGAKAQLDDVQRQGLEAVVVIFGRPALLVERGRFRAPDPPWEKLEQHRAMIETTLQSVGRIELKGHPSKDFVGTGFLVADDVVMTNRHVAKEFLVGPPDWPFEIGAEGAPMTARIDFNEEFDADTPREFEIVEVIGVIPDVDMALLRVDTHSASGQSLPAPLDLAGPMTAVADAEVYVIGYPVYDPVDGGDRDVLHAIFKDLYGVKRLQPGKVMSVQADQREFVHDCSTLGGNSGSCVVELQTGDVLGLHYSGFYLLGNHAVMLSEMQNHPLVKKADLKFV